MIFRCGPGIRRALVGAVAGALAAGCSVSPATDPLTPSTPQACASAGPTPTTEVTAALLPGLTLETRSDPASQVHASIPVLPQAAQLTAALRSQVDQGLARFRIDLAAAGGVGEYNVTSDVVGSSATAVGVLLTTRRSVGELRATSREVVWSDPAEQRLLPPTEMFTPDGWAELAGRLTRPTCAGSAFRAELLSEAVRNPGSRVRLSVAFGTNGNLVVIVDPLTPAADAFDQVLDMNQAGAWLSAAGRAAQRSATAPGALAAPAPPRPRPTPTPTPKPTARPKAVKPKVVKPKVVKPKVVKPKVVKPKVVKPKKIAPPVVPTRRPDCRRDRCVALTFDDGPGPHTANLLAQLRRAQAPATFFMVGQRVDAYPALARKVAQGGFEIGNHSYTHADLTRLSPAEAERELSRTSWAIQRATGRTVTLMRPPYGARNHDVDVAVRQAGLAEVLWDADTLDWRHRSSAYVTKRALRKTERGSIILMHDIHPTTVQAVPGLIRRLRERGYTLVTVSELLGPTQAGARYSHRS